MTNSIQLEKILYSYIRSNPNLYKKVKTNYFENKELAFIYKIEKGFVEKFNSVPTSKQIKELINIESEKNNEIDTETYFTIIDNLYKIDLTEYDTEWLKKTIEAIIYWKTLDNSMFDAITFMKSSDVKVDNVVEIVEKVKEIILERNNLSFGFSQGLDFLNYEAHIQLKSDYFTTGYPFFDKCLGGGYKRKTLVAFLGKQKSGKSLIMTNLAAELVKLGKNVVIITLEMSEKSVIKRVGSNLLKINMKDYDEISNDEKKFKLILNKFKKRYESRLDGLGKLFIKEFPTSAAGVPEIENYIKQLEETQNIKIDAVIVDYINIMKNWRNSNSENTYLKIKTISEDLRAMAVRGNYVVITATQTVRKKESSTELSAEDVSESIGLISTVDALFGIIQDESMRADGKYILKALALRDSEYIHEKQHFLVNYEQMRVKQDMNTQSYTNDNIFKNVNKINGDIDEPTTWG
jgi:KaiC/GvpD/RAD55 family RecA-like ATPase